MSLQTDRPPDTEVSPKPGRVQQPLHIRWTLALLLAIVIAGVAGVVVAAHLTGSPASTPTVSQEPNANTREGRVPAATIQEPNANTREGRLPAVTNMKVRVGTDDNCPLRRIGSQLVRCDNLTGAGVAAPSWVPAR